MTAAAIRRDVYGNAIDWIPTGRRRAADWGRLRAEMTKGETTAWMFCRPHEACAACAVGEDHDGCPTTERRGAAEGVRGGQDG